MTDNKSSSAHGVYLSVVVPVYNEKDNLNELCYELIDVLKGLKRSYEVILIDDGSIDGSFESLNSDIVNNSCMRIFSFSRNFGQTAALSAGFNHAKGEVVVPIDADLQNDPKDIARLLSKLEEGYDVVSGWRKDRKDHYLTRKLPSFIANKIIACITKVPLHDYGCTLKVYKRDVAKHLPLYGEVHRFLPVLASWQGSRVTEIEVNHRPRKFGKTKYGLNRTFKVVLDLFVLKFLLNFSSKPMYFFGALGFICIGLAFISGIASVIRKIFFGFYLVESPLLILTVFLLIIGIMFFFLGLLAELIIRLYHETLQKRIYTLKEK